MEPYGMKRERRTDLIVASIGAVAACFAAILSFYASYKSNQTEQAISTAQIAIKDFETNSLSVDLE
jgi:hypothetical protein